MLLDVIGVPVTVQNRLKENKPYFSEDEKRMAVLQYYVDTVPGASWGRIAGVLWYLQEHTALDTVRQYLPKGEHGSWNNCTVWYYNV